jgi:predicted ATPase/transcriptional regulator with XRE-family HTH domain
MQSRGRRPIPGRATLAEQLSKALADAFDEAGFTHAQVATKVGVSVDAVDAWTRGTDPHIPKEETLRKVCAHLELEQEGLGVQVAQVAKKPKDWVFLDPRGETGRGDESKVRSSVKAPHNLPRQRTRFLGRGEDVSTIVDLLKEDETCLVTLTGPGGSGKTRLALEVSERLLEERCFPDGVFFVPLASIRDADLLLSAILQTLRTEGSLELDGEKSLLRNLRDKHMLLVLDNLEQVPNAAPVIGKLLDDTRHLKVLATSLRDLKVTGEHPYPVSPFDVRDLHELSTPASLLENEAVQLFVQRVAIALLKSGFRVTAENVRSIANICTRLDGLPLAIELAAGRLRDLRSVETLEQRLRDRLGLLVDGAQDLPERQRTMRDMVQWSYDLLNEEEEVQFFRRMSIFRSSATVAAIDAVYNIDEEKGLDIFDLASLLVRDSLLVYDEQSERFSMLGTIREFALEKLQESGEMDKVREHYVRYYLNLAESEAPELDWPKADIRTDRLDDDLDEFRKILEWSRSSEGDEQIGLQLAGALGWFWELRGYIHEGLRWLVALLEGTKELRTVHRARALHAVGRLYMFQGDHPNVIDFFQEALDIYEEHNDEPGMAYALMGVGMATSHMNDGAEARLAYERSLEIRRRLEDKDGISHSLVTLGHLDYCAAHYDEARLRLEESVAIRRERGNLGGLAFSLIRLGRLELFEGKFDRAKVLFEEALELAERIRHPLERAWALNKLAHREFLLRNYSEAVLGFRKSLQVYEKMENRGGGVIECLIGLASAHFALDEKERAAVLWGAAESLQKGLNFHLDPTDQDDFFPANTDIEKDFKQSSVEYWRKGRSLSWEEAIAYALAMDKSGGQ